MKILHLKRIEPLKLILFEMNLERRMRKIETRRDFAIPQVVALSRTRSFVRVPFYAFNNKALHRSFRITIRSSVVHEWMRASNRVPHVHVRQFFYMVSCPLIPCFRELVTPFISIIFSRRKSLCHFFSITCSTMLRYSVKSIIIFWFLSFSLWYTFCQILKITTDDSFFFNYFL